AQPAALHEHHGVVGRQSQQVAQVGLGLIADLHEVLAAVAHFHHGHTAAVPVQHFGGGLLQHRLGQGRRACREIPGASHHYSVGSVGSDSLPWAPGSSPPWPSPPSPGSSPPSSSSASASLSTTRRTPDRLLPSSTLISVTPCVARPISRISATRVRTSTPPVV